MSTHEPAGRKEAKMAITQVFLDEVRVAMGGQELTSENADEFFPLIMTTLTDIAALYIGKRAAQIASGFPVPPTVGQEIFVRLVGTMTQALTAQTVEKITLLVASHQANPK